MQLVNCASGTLVDESNLAEGKGLVRYASGLCPDPADRLFAPEGSPNLGSHPFGWHERLYSILETLYSSTLKYPGGGEGIRTPGTLRFI